MLSMVTHDKRVIIGLSGGVDSAVAAALLLERGFDVQGVMLHLWQAPFVPVTEAPPEKARAVAETLGIPFSVLDLREQFLQQVVQRFVQGYAEGKTPNPCVLCNPTLKFEALLETATGAEARWIATGHYARVAHPPSDPESGAAPAITQLLRAASPQRDQSYVLYRLTQRHLSHLLLPLGDLEDKTRVREIAQHLSLPSADAPDSQDLCFLKGGDYRSLLETMIPDELQPGPILDETGEVLGEHQGLPRYTIGQRSGLGIATGDKVYVLGTRPEENALIIGPAERLERQKFQLEQVTFIAGAPPASTFDAEIRIRYRAPLVPATVTLLADNHAQVYLHLPQRGIAPGQSAVFYHGETVLGGGIISPYTI